MPTEPPSTAGESRTLVAVFGSEEAATAASRALEEGGIAAARIRRFPGAKGATAFAPGEQNSGSLMDWLLGEEAPVRDKSIYSRGGGSHVLAITTGPGEHLKVAEVLRACGPATIEELPAGQT